MDEVTLLATITMFLVWGPEEISQTPAIQTQCVIVFKDCWESKNPEVRLRYTPTCKSLSYVVLRCQVKSFSLRSTSDMLE